MGFDFTIAIAPKGNNIDRELQYIKAALLYADKITLISPVAYFYSQLSEKTDSMDLRKMVQLMEYILPLVCTSDPRSGNELNQLIAQLRPWIQNKGKYRAIPMMQRMEIKRNLLSFCDDLNHSLSDKIGIEQSQELQALLQSKRVILKEFEHDLSDSDGMVAEYFNVLNKAIHNSYPLFDEQSNDLMAAAVHSKIINLSDIDARKIKHAGLSDDFMQRLPSFDQAPVDEILDVRKELDPSISRFRSKMISYSDTLQTMPWDKDFESECSLLYYQEVAPAITEIDELSKDNSLLKNLGGKLFADKDLLTSAGQLAVSVAAGGVIQTFAETASFDTTLITTGSVWAAQKLKSAYDEYSEKKKEIKKKDLYFYYQAGKKLSK